MVRITGADDVADVDGHVCVDVDDDASQFVRRMHRQQQPKNVSPTRDVTDLHRDLFGRVILQKTGLGSVAELVHQIEELNRNPVADLAQWPWSRPNELAVSRSNLCCQLSVLEPSNVINV